MKYLCFFMLCLFSAQTSFAQIEVEEELEIMEEEPPEVVQDYAPPPPPPTRVRSASVRNPFQYTNNYGKIKRLYPTKGRLFFSLQGGRTAMNPKNGYYEISKSHDNYEVLVEVLMTAVERDMVIKVRTEPKKTKGGYALVNYLVLDF